MVEIILRKDPSEYEARPLLGFTYRQVVTGVLIAVTGAGMGLGISQFTELNTFWLMCIMTVCGGIGLVGLGRINGLKFEDWFKIWKADHDWPQIATYGSPVLSAYPERRRVKAKRNAKKSKRRQRAEKAWAAEAAAESEA